MQQHLAAIGSGGVYSTPGDMMRWMQQFLSSDFYTRSQQADRMQTLIYQRNQLTRVIGMDVPGRADALGLGWVYMKPKNGHPGIIQKTGGGGGFITYMAMNPQANVGAFVVVTRSPLTRFNNMSDGINDFGQRVERRTTQHADGQPVSPGKVSPMRHNDRFGETSRCHFSYTIVFHFTKSGKP